VTGRDPGWVYLLHFEHEIGSEDNPRGRAGHYLGHTGRDDLDARLAEHRAGRGARITQVLLEQGVEWKLVRTWPGGRDLERALKDQKHANRLCPECQPNPQPGTTRKLPPARPARATPEHQALPAEPQRKHVSQYDQGTRTADQVVGRLIAAGRTSAQIKAHHEYSTAPFYSGEIHHTAAAVERMEGYCQRYEELLAGVHEKEAAAAKETRKEGRHAAKFDPEPKPEMESAAERPRPPGGPWYHGTKHELAPGQELTATGARQADSGYPGHIRHVWVTTKPLAAAMHATKHGTEYWDSGHVYQVEPLAPADVEIDPLDNGNGASWRSPTGFRVIRDIGTPTQLWEEGREKGQRQQRSAGKETAMEGEQETTAAETPQRPPRFNPKPVPATEYQKGVAAAHTLILRQVDAGRNADHIAAIHETAQTSFHGAERTPQEWEFYNGYASAAGQLVQDLRDVEAAKAARQPGREPVTAPVPEADREMAS